MEDLSGRRFGHLEVIRYHHTRNKARVWECRCDCGMIRLVRTSSLNAGVTSCGCQNRKKPGPVAVRYFPELRYAAVADGYDSLFKTLVEALEQAQAGKGKERHANGEPFDRQEICAEARKLGLAGPAMQARKKVREALRLLEISGPEAAVQELLGAINYTAAMAIVMRGKK